MNGILEIGVGKSGGMGFIKNDHLFTAAHVVEDGVTREIEVEWTLEKINAGESHLQRYKGLLAVTGEPVLVGEDMIKIPIKKRCGVPSIKLPFETNLDKQILVRAWNQFGAQHNSVGNISTKFCNSKMGMIKGDSGTPLFKVDTRNGEVTGIIGVHSAGNTSHALGSLVCKNIEGFTVIPKNCQYSSLGSESK